MREADNKSTNNFIRAGYRLFSPKNGWARPNGFIGAST
jgi:hypothetical protein